MQLLHITILLLINFPETFSEYPKNCLEYIKVPQNLKISCNQCINGYALNQNNECIKIQSINSHYMEKICLRNLGTLIA